MNTGLNGAKICQIQVAGSSGTGTSPSLLVGIGTSLSGTDTTCLLHHGYRYHFLVPVSICDFAPKMSGFGIFTHFSSINLLQFIPYKKSTMESTQNNSKGGLESMKTLFSQVRAFSQIENHKKDEVRV